MRAFQLSLAALLVTVCRLCSAAYISWGYVDFYARGSLGNESPFFLTSEERANQYAKFVLGNLTEMQSAQLDMLLGNTIYAMILDRLGKYETLPAYYKSALDNGVLCEVDEQLTISAVQAIQYHADTLTSEQRAAEVEAARDPAIGFDCKKGPSFSPDYAYNSFCRQRIVLLYGAALKFRERIAMTGVTRKTCERELIDPLLASVVDPRKIPNNPALFIASYLPDDYLHLFNRSFHSHEAPDRNAEMHCFAGEPEAEAAVKSLFAASGLRWTLEAFQFRVAFGGAQNDIDSACAVQSFKTSEVGQCACSKETGISFCISKARAAYYKKIGYLTCNGDSMIFNSDARPSTIPPFDCLSDSAAAATAPECEQYRKAQ